MEPPTRPDIESHNEIGHLETTASIDALVASILAHQTQSPVMQTADSSSLATLLPKELPDEGCELSRVITEFQETAGSFYRKNAHPGMYAFVAGPGLPTDPLAHALTAALNQNVTGAHSAPGATAIERTLVRWLCQLAGLPEHSDGLFLGGGSWANLSALAVAVHQGLGPETRERGVRTIEQPVILATETAHFSIPRAARILGLGQNALETVPLDSHHRLDAGALRNQLTRLSAERDKLACCVVATAGTTAMGVIDPLEEIASICGEFGVWLHIDAAYGGAALLSDSLRDRLRGIAQADSITIDLHKWGYQAFDASVLLYRNPQRAREVFAFQADYARFDQTAESDAFSFFDLSPEVSRRARALSTYVAWRHYGLNRLGRNILHNAECASYLAECVDSADDMELVAWPRLSICCFRYKPQSSEISDYDVDSLNDEIVTGLRAGQDFILSSTHIDARPVLRVCICSHYTRASHMDALLNAVRKIGESLV